MKWHNVLICKGDLAQFKEWPSNFRPYLNYPKIEAPHEGEWIYQEFEDVLSGDIIIAVDSEEGYLLHQETDSNAVALMPWIGPAPETLKLREWMTTTE